MGDASASSPPSADPGRAESDDSRQRIDELGTALAGLAHEIRNPLQFIKNFAESVDELCAEMRDVIAEAELRPDVAGDLAMLETEFSDASSRIVEHAARIDALVDTMQFAMAEERTLRQWTDLSELVGRAVAAARAEVDDASPTVDVDVAEGLPPVLVDAEGLRLALTNLIVNALEALVHAPDGGEDRVVVSVVDDDRSYEITVTDTGPGPAAGTESRIFEPFFTQWPGRTHAGLGLPQARDIVARHGGTLIAGRTEEGHTTFTVTIAR